MPKNIKAKRDKRTLHFVSAFSGHFLTTPIHRTISRLRRKYGISWLRFRMSYTRFSSVDDLLQVDLRSKVDEGVHSGDFLDEVCNCQARMKVDGKCIFGGGCRRKCVIYKYECTVCGEEYIGSTQNSAKERLKGHCQDARDWVRLGKPTDTFAQHFGRHVKELGLEPSAANVRSLVKPSILWQGSSNLATSRRFGTDQCVLCGMEKYFIFVRRGAATLCNQNSEYYGVCRHRPRVHQLYAEEVGFNRKWRR